MTGRAVSERAEVLEARARNLMAQRARLAPAWNTRHERAELLAAIHAELDEWLRVTAGEREMV